MSLAIGEDGVEVIVESVDIVLQCGELDYAAEARYFSLCRSPVVHQPNHPIRPQCRGGKPMYHCHGMHMSPKMKIPSFPLSMAGEGEMVRVALLPQGSKIQERLMSMGICINDEVTVVQKQHDGALMIEKNGARYALGGSMAHTIQVVKS